MCESSRQVLPADTVLWLYQKVSSSCQVKGERGLPDPSDGGTGKVGDWIKMHKGRTCSYTINVKLEQQTLMTREPW